jgi:hypothetical protein
MHDAIMSATVDTVAEDDLQLSMDTSLENTVQLGNTMDSIEDSALQMGGAVDSIEENALQVGAALDFIEEDPLLPLPRRLLPKSAPSDLEIFMDEVRIAQHAANNPHWRRTRPGTASMGLSEAELDDHFQLTRAAAKTRVWYFEATRMHSNKHASPAASLRMYGLGILHVGPHLCSAGALLVDSLSPVGDCAFVGGPKLVAVAGGHQQHCLRLLDAAGDERRLQGRPLRQQEHARDHLVQAAIPRGHVAGLLGNEVRHAM